MQQLIDQTNQFNDLYSKMDNFSFGTVTMLLFAGMMTIVFVWIIPKIASRKSIKLIMMMIILLAPMWVIGIFNWIEHDHYVKAFNRENIELKQTQKRVVVEQANKYPYAAVISGKIYRPGTNNGDEATIISLFDSEKDATNFIKEHGNQQRIYFDNYIMLDNNAETELTEDSNTILNVSVNQINVKPTIVALPNLINQSHWWKNEEGN